MDEKVFSVLGVFDNPDALVDAVKKIRPRALGRLEAYTPYPIHGIDEHLGLRRSPLAGMVLVMGLLGSITALFFQWWMSAVDYPLVTGGKPLFSWQAFVPIMFEVTVLFATFTAGLGMLLLLNKLPFFGHPILASRAIERITRDKFALAIESETGDLKTAEARSALEEAGAREIEVLSRPLQDAGISAQFILRTLLAIAVSCGVAGQLTYWAIKLFPVFAPMSHMQEQPRLDPQSPSQFFRNGIGMRPPVPGTVARNHLPMGVDTQEEAAILVNPLPRTSAVLEEGKRGFTNHCAVCHGPLGNGVPSLTAAYGAKPANLISQQFRDMPDGKVYWTLVRGKGAMPSYAYDLSEKERWAVVHYVRVLQRAQNARPEDLK